MKILITGSTGLLGQALTSRLSPSHDVTGLSRGVPIGRHVACELRDVARTAEVVQSLRPDVVIHTQALSDVDRCEREPQLAQSQNVQTTAHLIRAMAGLDAWLIALSTDYVFDGTKGSPYDERDAPNPLGVYGRTKLEAERLVLERPRSVVARTSTLYGPGRASFCDHAVERLRAGRPVEAFTDQVTSPTYAADLADGLAELSEFLSRSPLERWPRLYHLANAGGCSRVEFVERCADLLGRPRDGIRRIRMADQRRDAPRPSYSALTSISVPQVLERTLRPWDDALRAYLHDRWLS